MANDRFDLRVLMDLWGDQLNEWQGVPVPVPGIKLKLHDRHPLAEKMAKAEEILEQRGPLLFSCDGDDSAKDVVVVNKWFSYSRHAWVYLVLDAATGGRRVVLDPVAVDHGMQRLKFALTTLGASDAWTIDAELKALEKLEGMLTTRQLHHYILTGAFLETSPRSRVTYLFRRGRPTVVMTPRWDDPEQASMRCLAVLCLHPVGYYEASWAGCMTPTDDVIAHLLLMRGDEPGFWRQANQHPAWSAEAGL